MQFTSNNAKMVTTMKSCLGLITPREPFNRARLTADNGNIEINCTNTRTTCSALIPATVETPGVACIEIKTAYNVLSKLPMDAEITFTMESGERSELVLTQGKRKYKLPVSNGNPESFNAVEFPQGESFFDEENTIANAIDAVKPYVSGEESMEAISCVLLRGEGSKLNVVGLNGHQFCRVSQETDFINLLDGDVLVSLRGLIDIKGWLFGGKGVKYAIDAKRMFFRQETDGIITTFSILRSDYTYPNYGNFIAKVIEAENPAKLISDRVEMLDAINRLSIFATESNRQVLLKHDPTTNEFQMFNTGSETGKGVEPLDVAVDGDVPRIAFPTLGLTTVLNTFDSNKVCLTITGSENPCLVEGMDNQDKGVSAILMPMMIQEETYYAEEGQAAA